MSEFIMVRTGGSPREIGFDVGRATAGIVRELAAANPAFYRRETGQRFEAIKRYFLRNFLPFAVRRYPDHVEEIRGLAEGAGLPFDDVAVFSAEEELLDTWGGWDKCSTAVVRSRGRLLLAHNEDYIGRYHDRLVLIEAEPRRRPAFLSLGYPGTLAGSSCGLNAAGLAEANNSLRFRPRRRGLPKNFVLRDLLAARSLAEARRLAVAGPRVVAGNICVASAAEDRALALETSLDQTAVVELGAGPLVHTNHVISPEIDVSGERPTEHSRRRYAALTGRLARRGSRVDARFLQDVLGDRSSGLRRFSLKPQAATTLATVIMDPAARSMLVAAASGRRVWHKYVLK